MKSRVAAILIFAVTTGLWVLGFVWAHFISTNPSSILSLLGWLSPAAFILSVCAVFFAVIACRAAIVRTIRLLRWKDWIWLIAIVGLVLLVRVTMIPATERLYYDEHTYLQIARGIADEGRARVAAYGVIQQPGYRCMVGSYPHWSVGWPTLLAGVLRCTDYGRWAASAVNLTLSLGTMVFLALMASALFPKTRICLATAAVYASLPANQLWSRTSASEALAVFCATLAVLSAVIYAQNPSRRFGYMLAASLAMAVQVRNEMVLLIPVVAVFVSMLGGRRGLQKAYWPAVLLIILLFPQSIHLGCVSRGYDPSIMEGAIFSFRYFPSNIESVFHYFCHEPVTFVCLIIAALGAYKVRSEKVAIPLWAWGLAALGPSMFYFAGSYSFPGGERFLLSVLPAVALSAGVGFYTIHLRLARHSSSVGLLAVWMGVFLSAMVWVGPYVAEKDQETLIPRTDCEFLRAALRHVPDDGIVITADPPAVIAEGRSAVLTTWVGRNSVQLRELAAGYPNNLFYFVSTSSSADYWPHGLECEQRLFSFFRAKVVVQEAGPEGHRVLYSLEEVENAGRQKSRNTIAQGVI